MNSLDIRSRWDGILGPEEVRQCIRAKISLGFDPVQNGWVPLNCRDREFRATPEETTPTSGLRGYKRDNIQGIQNTGDIQHVIRNINKVISKAQHDLDVDALDKIYIGMLAEWVKTNQINWAGDDVVSVSDYRFRKWTREDATALVKLLDNENIWTYLPDERPVPFTFENAIDLIEISNLDGVFETRAITVGDEPVGQVAIRFDSNYSGLKSAEISYWLGEQFWGRGLMRDALRGFVQLCYGEFEIDFLYAWIHAENQSSARTLKNCGFRRLTVPFGFEQSLATKRNRINNGRYLSFNPRFTV